ncbi:excisionase [Paraburkholderia sp.]|uniref:excisionase n=1 Tax=Paraburkholderia sp. TaxID=1926495 RepID=UPI003448E7F6
MAAQLIPVRTWAEGMFGERVPHANTLLNWIKNGKIRPLPRKVGRQYFCRPDAEYVDPRVDRIERMSRGR